jgi:UDP-N-acetylmuramate dehydrogenase
VLASLNSLIKSINGIVLFDEPLKRHTTFQIGGPARILVIPQTIEDIQESVRYARLHGLRIQVIGNGSKLLFSDNGFSGVVIKISDTLNYSFITDNKLFAEAGCYLSRLIALSTSRALSGLEFAAGIPGTLGGAIVMNAGTALGSINDVVSKIDAISLDSGSLRTFSNSDCDFQYRDSIFRRNPWLITRAELILSYNDKRNIQKKIDEFIKNRIDSQPLDKPSAGSIFKNPEGYSAARLIDSANLKGVRVGHAQISDKHANFIVNLGNATAKDVIGLIKLIQAEVKAKFSISLIPELVIIEEN